MRKRAKTRSRLSRTKEMRKSADQRLNGASRLDVNGWIFLKVRGDASDIGFQNGKLLTNEIVHAVEAVKLLAEGGYGRSWKFFCDTAMQLFWPKLPAEYRDEIQGIVDGVKANRAGSVRLEDIMGLNSYFDVVSYHYWLKSKEAGQQKQISRAEHCSAFIATGDQTEDGQIVLAHNTWFQYLPGRTYNVMIDSSPTKGERFVMQTMPGTISSGTDWYVNNHGLVVSETTITGMTTFNPDGLPYFLRSRKAVQYASTIDEWVKIMIEKNSGGYADDWLVGDTKTGEIAWLELGTFKHKLERTRNGYFLGSNVALSDEVRSETSYDYGDKSTSCTARYERLKELVGANEGKLNVEFAKVLLADHHDSYSNEDKANRNTICGHIEADPRGIPEWEYGPSYPGGSFDGKVTDSTLAKQGAFWAHWGKPCDMAFEADTFLKSHPEYEWQRPRLRDVRPYPWTLFVTTPEE